MRMAGIARDHNKTWDIVESIYMQAYITLKDRAGNHPHISIGRSAPLSMMH